MVPALSTRPDQTRSDQKITEMNENVKMSPSFGLLVAAGTNWSMMEPHKQKSSINNRDHNKEKKSKNATRNAATQH